MTAALAVRHHVAGCPRRRAVHGEAESLRARYGRTARRVFKLPDEADSLLVTHGFPGTGHASGFAGDPALIQAMRRGGVQVPPRIEVLASA